MNHIDENIALALGPCADYEFDLVELSEHPLTPDRAPLMQQHLAHCARCSAYLAELQTLDAALVAALPVPALSPDFDARLAQRIAVLKNSSGRSATLAAEYAEYQQALRTLGRAINWRTALNAIGAGAVAGVMAVAGMQLAPAILASLDPRAPMVAAYGIALAAMAAGLLPLRRPQA